MVGDDELMHQGVDDKMINQNEVITGSTGGFNRFTRRKSCFSRSLPLRRSCCRLDRGQGNTRGDTPSETIPQ